MYKNSKLLWSCASLLNQCPIHVNLSDLPKYRHLAQHYNNPYKDEFKKTKPTTYRERYIESIRNAPKPKIGTGQSEKDFLKIKRQAPDRRHSFYKDERRTTFTSLGVSQDLSCCIAEVGATKPSYHQSDVIPVLLAGKNLVFISPTGSGKTYSFLLPTVQSLLKSNAEGYITRARAPRTIIMTPTKELSLQVGKVAQHLVQDLDLRVLCLTEHGRKGQLTQLNLGPTDILIGTYESVETHITSGNISTCDLEHLVIDEIDNFLDYRRIAEREVFLREYVDEGSTRCQIIMCGAVLPQDRFQMLSNIIPDLDRYLNSLSHSPLPHVEQKFCFITNNRKSEHFTDWLAEHCSNNPMSTHRPLIFCNFNNTAHWLHKHLISCGLNNILLSTIVKARTRVTLMQREIPNTQFPIVTTDAFASGLDFREFGTVVNYEFPFTYEDYLRRMGRTGRLSSNSNTCQIVSYVSKKSDKDLYNIIKKSSEARECQAYTLSKPNRGSWLMK